MSIARDVIKYIILQDESSCIEVSSYVKSLDWEVIKELKIIMYVGQRVNEGRVIEGKEDAFYHYNELKSHFNMYSESKDIDIETIFCKIPYKEYLQKGAEVLNII